MSLAPRLDLRQSQQLVMTPQLQQAIKLLALNNLELESFVAAELEKNPLLKADDGDAPGEERGAAEEPEPEMAAPAAGEWDEPLTADRLIETGDSAADAPLDIDYEAGFQDQDSAGDPALRLDGGLDSTRSSGSLPDRAGGDIEALSAAATTLAEHLLAQAGAAFSGAELLIAQHLIDLIDEAGYFEGDVEEVAQRLGATRAEVMRVLEGIQRFDPAGVGARTLGECLAIQAREADRLDPAMARLLNNLQLVARGDLAGLRRICGVDSEDLADMLRELRSYNPKPGLAFGGGPVPTVAPDIYVHRTSSGWSIELNSATLPRVLVDRNYYVELARGSATGGRARETRAFLSECLQSANWLVKALDQRARTIVKVATELVRQQEAFFERGIHYLRPLNLKTVADAIGMHESTVSRVTSNKYLSCERGLFELRFFFTSAIQAADGGEAVSARAVQERIRALIAAETPDAILSDDQLVELLKAEGFDIARRTVAKYREGMGIGSSVQRRRQSRLIA